MNLKVIQSAVLSLTLTSTAFGQSANRNLVPRPPQFVLLAFDGSRELKMWEETREFAAEMTAKGAPVRFTYFISGVYFVHEGNRTIYHPPYRQPGRSDIGVGASPQDILERVDLINDAIVEGHEIGSHANGHFDGSDGINKGKFNWKPWTFEDWTSEFRQFNELVFGAFRNNGLNPRHSRHGGWLISEKDVLGFRAPVLGVSEGLWPTLKNFGFRYDTSKVNYPWYWPRKDAHGLWQFPLAEIPVVGTAKKTLSMDYNFYVVQSRGEENLFKADPSVKERFRKEMYESYMSYFHGNYYGRRAPLHIGHHFSRWNGGAYWEAMKDFARSVCGMSEVRCVTYREYMDWLESLNNSQLEAYRAGSFERLAKPTTTAAPGMRTFNVSAQLRKVENEVLLAKATGHDLKTLGGAKVRISINDKLLEKSSLSLKDLRTRYEKGSKIRVGSHVITPDGTEIHSVTHVIENLGTDRETISTEPWEARALQGDLPEAHLPLE